MQNLNIKQIALLSQLSESSVRRLIYANKLSAAEKNSNKEGYRVSVDELVDKGIATREEIERFILAQGSLASQKSDSEIFSQDSDEKDIFAWRGVLYSSDFTEPGNLADIEPQLKREFILLEKKKSELLVRLSRKRQECARLETLLESAQKETEEIKKYINKFKNQF